jgi:hypothetical protein
MGVAPLPPRVLGTLLAPFLIVACVVIIIVLVVVL